MVRKLEQKYSRNINLKISFQSIFSFVTLLIILMPSTIKIFGSYKFLIIEALSVIIILKSLVVSKTKFSGFIYLLFLFQLEFVFSALINGTQYMQFIYTAIPIIDVCLLSYIEMRRNQKSYIDLLIYSFAFYSTIHLFARLFQNDLGYDSFGNILYFLGTDNQATSYLLCLFIFSLLKLCLYGFNPLSVYGIAVPVFIAFYSGCGTAMVVYTIIGMFFVFGSMPFIKKIVQRLASYRFIFILYIILTILLLSVPSFLGTTSIGNAVSDLTGKSVLTFSKRTFVWSAALEVFFSHPIFGIGYGAEGNGVYALGNYRGAHNQLLQWAVLGGIVSVVLFLVMLYLSMKNTSTISAKKRFYILLSIFGYLICMDMENYFNGIHILLIMSVYFHLSYSANESINKGEEKC